MKRKQVLFKSYFWKVTVVLLVALTVLQRLSSFAAEVQIPGYYGGTVTIPDNQLPSARIDSVDGEYNITSDGSDMIVDQEQERVVIDWDSFNIGKEASVHFSQESSSWAALNRIYDTSASQILGKLSADGTIYLINQNGILFGPDSQVNVHSLVASALNISDEDFLDEEMKFHYGTDEDGNASDDGYYDGDDEDYALASSAEDVEKVFVANYGTITTDDDGSVYLLGPNVKNYGDIYVPFGQIALAAANELEMVYTTNMVQMTESYVLTTGEDEDSGTVINGAEGTLQTYSIDDEGNTSGSGGFIGLMGRAVQNDGVIRSVTSLLNQSVIELRARDSIVTGEDSGIYAVINSSDETLVDTESLRDESEPFGAEVTFGGLTTGSNKTYYDYKDSVEVIDHKGEIVAYSGTVNMYADQWIYLEASSLIDVSGIWASGSGDSNEIEAQLNSYQLRDEIYQQDGSLQGKTVTFNAILGSNIGDTSGYLTSDEKTALEAATSGGDVNLWVGVDESDEKVNDEIESYRDGDVVIADTATIDISGGGIQYDSGYISTTYLVTKGGSVYSLSDSPDGITDYQIITEQTFSNSKYGDETYSGLYYGGAVAVGNYVGPYIQGSDAGTLSVIAPTVVLSGVLDGSVINGLYQTEEEDPTDEYSSDSVTAIGRAKANQGVLIVGNSANSDTDLGTDYITDEIVISEEGQDLGDVTATVDGVFATDLYTDTTSLLEADTIESAQLSSVTLYSNTSVTVDEEVSLLLEGNSFFAAYSSYIDIEGEIYAPGGEIELTLEGTYLDVIDQVIYLGSEGVLSVEGEKTDNSLADVTGEAEAEPLYTEGGSITLSDNTSSGLGVYTSAGSLISVDGGYYIDENGDVEGADAGSLSIQGHSIVLDGDLSGLSLVGQSGGSIELHASEITVTLEEVALGGATDFVSSISVLKGLTNEEDGYTFGSLTLNQERFANSGFSQISLLSTKDLTVESGVVLTPSTEKLVVDITASDDSETEDEDSNNESTISLGSDQVAGDSSITLKAGINDNATNNNYLSSIALTLESGSSIEVAPQGKVTLEAPNVEIGAVISAPAGTIDIAQLVYNQTDEVVEGTGALTLLSGAQLLAQGYNLEIESTLNDSWVDYSPLDAGIVTLYSGGALGIEDDVLIDVSAAKAVTRTVQSSGSLTRIQDGGAGGSVDITYYKLSEYDEEGGFTFSDTLQAGTSLSGASGGELSITSLNELSTGDTIASVELYQSDINDFIAAGFDSLSFGSDRLIYFASQLDFELSGTLSLDAPLIESASGLTHNIQASLIQISNTNELEASSSTDSGSSLSLLAEWMEIEGSIIFSGFDDITLKGENAISLSDNEYKDSDDVDFWAGEIETGNDLKLISSVIYPTSEAVFTVTAGGELVVETPETVADVTVLSAGGQLTLQASSIDFSGIVSAPMGQIDINADDTLFVSSESILSVSSDYYLSYGMSVVDSNKDTYYWWKVTTRDDDGYDEGTNTVSEALESSITLSAGTDENEGAVVVQSGAEIDISGGGGLARSYFLAGSDGSVDPLDDEYYSNRYVIVPGVNVVDSDDVNAGLMIEISGSDLLEAGTYYILPDKYAYLPGAVIVETTGTELVSSNLISSVSGTYVASGNLYQYGTEATGVDEIFILYSAEDLIGDSYTVDTIEAGDAGALYVDASTVLLDGTLIADALDGYNGGLFSLSASSIDITSSGSVTLSDLMTFDSVADDVAEAGLSGTASISADFLSGSSLKSAALVAEGDDGENSITIQSGVDVQLNNLSLEAEDDVIIEGDAHVEAIEGGEITIASASLRLEQGAQIEATTVSLDINDLDLFGGEFLSDSGTLNIKSSTLYLVADGYELPDDGVYLTESLSGFSGFTSVYLKSESDLIFVDVTDGNGVNVNLTGLETTLSIDAARLVAASGNVSLSANQVTLQNSEGVTAGDFSSTTTNADLTVKADQLTIGPNYVEEGDDGNETVSGIEISDGFETVNLISSGDLIFSGETRLDVEGTGSITLKAERIIATYFYDEETESFSNGDAVLNATGRSLFFEDADPEEDSDTSDFVGAGSTLEVKAASVTNNTIIVAKAGLVTIDASGDINMSGSIDVSGVSISGTVDGEAYSETYDAGKVVLTSSGGNIEMQGGSLLDVSAGDAENAGTIILSAVSGSVGLDGTLDGIADEGDGGSFTVNSGDELVLDTLSDLLMSSGFTDAIEIETHDGDLLLSEGHLLAANSVTLTADGDDEDDGKLTIAGKINVSDDTAAGEIELWANNDLTVTGSLLATGLEGGSVQLSTEEGTLVLGSDAATATIDVRDEDSTSGTVYLRALSDQTDDADDTAAHFNVVSATIDADEIKVEGFARDARDSVTSEVTQDHINTLIDTADNDAEDIVAAFKSVADVTFVPGVEITNTGSLTIEETISLDADTTESIFDAGALTLRAANNVTVSANITSRINAKTPTIDSALVDKISSSYRTVTDSWNVSLVAGADLDSADTGQTLIGYGDLNIGENVLIYTEDGLLTLGAGNDIEIGASKSWTGYVTPAGMRYSIGTFAGDIDVFTGGDFDLSAGAAIQSAVGDIAVTVGSNLLLGNEGAIRSVGSVVLPTGGESLNSRTFSSYVKLLYTNGGLTNLSIDGSVLGELDSDYWYEYYTQTGSLTDFLQWDSDEETYTGFVLAAVSGASGIISSGGGDISARVYGDFSAQIGSFYWYQENASESNNLTLLVGGDLDGRFHVYDGTAVLKAGGNFGLGLEDSEDDDGLVDQVLEAFNAQYYLSAQGSINLGSVVNPTLDDTAFKSSTGLRYMSYAQSASVELTALLGDIVLSGQNDIYTSGTYSNIVPATFIAQSGQDIVIEDDFVLMPAEEGTLTLVAKGDIVGEERQNGSSTSIKMLGSLAVEAGDEILNLYGSWIYMGEYDELSVVSGALADEGDLLLHSDDTVPVIIAAGGDIDTLRLDLSKKAQISAAENITNLSLYAQNVGADGTDVTSIRAGGNLTLEASSIKTGIVVAGSGSVIVQVGDTLDLGTSKSGIRTVGQLYDYDQDAYNYALGDSSDLVILAGTDLVLTAEEAEAFFSELRTAAENYSIANSEGTVTVDGVEYTAAEIAELTQSEIIDPLFEGAETTGGSVNMSMSTIQTYGSDSDIYLISAGGVIVGQSAFDDSSDTGILTEDTSEIELLRDENGDIIYDDDGYIQYNVLEVVRDENGNAILNDDGSVQYKVKDGGSDINIFAVDDVDVLESRVMTKFGSDILIWCAEGDVNAGRGATTALSAGSPVYDDSYNVIGYNAPSLGSGIRALSYDRDGEGGSDPAPVAGDVYVAVPQGILDAGEAGIRGNSVILGATEVRNSQNISFSAGSVGVPVSSGSISGLGNVSGDGVSSEMAKIANDTANLGEESLSEDVALIDDFIAKWIEAKVIGYPDTF